MSECEGLQQACAGPLGALGGGKSRSSRGRKERLDHTSRDDVRFDLDRIGQRQIAEVRLGQGLV